MASIGGFAEAGAVPQPYRLTEEEKQKHLKMMRTPDEWPRWPFLPVKQPMSFGLPRCGVLSEVKWGEKIEPIIYDYIVFMAAKDFEENKVLAKFNSFEEMLEAGWVVD